MSNNRPRHKHKREATPYVPPFDANLLAQPVGTLSPSADLAAKLEKGNVATLLDVVKRTERDFFRIPTFNKKNLIELKRLVEGKSLYLRPLPPPPENGVNAPNDERHEHNRGQSQPPKNAPQGGKNERGNGSKGQQNPQQGGNRNAQSVGGKGNSNQPKNARQEGGRPMQKGQGANNNGAEARQKGNDRNKKAEKGRGGRIWEPDGVSEQATKAERERKRPRRQVAPVQPDAYLKINRNGKWGFQDRSGKEVVAPVYDEVFSYKEDLCCVEKEGLFGFIDRNGDEVIPAVYECASSFSEGLACVFKNGNCGYINKQNEVVVDFRFDAGTAVLDGNCRVKREGKWGELWPERPLEIRWIN